MGRMKILILGGTQFIGRHLTLAFLAAGHTVSVLTRGLSPDDLPRKSSGFVAIAMGVQLAFRP